MEATPGVVRKLYRTDATGDPSTFKLLKTFDGTGEDTLTTWTDTGAAATGAAMDDSTIKGDYTYYVTYYDQYGNESLPSAPISPSAMGEDGRIQLQDIPADTTGYWTGGRKIYRGTKGSDTFYEVGDIPGNTSQVVNFTDDTPDSAVDKTKTLDFSGPRINDTTTLAVNVLQRDGDDYTHVFGTGGTFTFTPQRAGERSAPRR